jgi:xanthine dehydrogenase accessory factor
LRIAMLPLRSLPGVDALIDGWLHTGVSLSASIGADGGVAFDAGSQGVQWSLDTHGQHWSGDATSWRLSLPRLPRLLILGAGPETPTLIPLLRELGWWVCIAERRARWRDVGTSADARLQGAPAAALHDAAPDAVLVMHHDFELDREALDALAATDIDFIGLLGPRRRRDDLFKLLTQVQRDSLSPRLRSPVGLDLGGRGPQAIALSIAAQLQQWRIVAASA